MQYTELAEEIRTKLEANFYVLLKYSDAQGEPRDTVLAATLVSLDSQITPRSLVGFDYKGSATDAFRQWFEFTTANKGDNEATREALHALMSVDAEYAEPRIKELEA